MSSLAKSLPPPPNKTTTSQIDSLLRLVSPQSNHKSRTSAYSTFLSEVFRNVILVNAGMADSYGDLVEYYDDDVQTLFFGSEDALISSSPVASSPAPSATTVLGRDSHK